MLQLDLSKTQMFEAERNLCKPLIFTSQETEARGGNGGSRLRLDSSVMAESDRGRRF